MFSIEKRRQTDPFFEDRSHRQGRISWPDGVSPLAVLLSEARQGTLLLCYVRKDGWNLADDNNTRLCSRKMGWLVWFSRLKMSYRRKLGTFWYFFFEQEPFLLPYWCNFSIGSKPRWWTKFAAKSLRTTQSWYLLTRKFSTGRGLKLHKKILWISRLA